ncbi:MAG: nucleoside-diphosphate sugar epimerase/dehydratase [Bacteroidales bacterium]|nr:nucleoside-diphosphate sugar epimerase/dehydratase [Bacteroidales bacterium]
MEFFKRPFPRWALLLIDLAITGLAIPSAFLLRFNFDIPAKELDPMPGIIFILISARFVSFLIARVHAGMMRYTSTHDAGRIALTNFVVSLLLGISNLITWQYAGIFYFPFSILIMEFLLTTVGMIFIRLLVKTAYLEFSGKERQKMNVIIFGAGQAGMITKSSLERDAGIRYKTLAFVDDDSKKAGKKMDGVTVHHSAELDNFLKNNDIDIIILAVQNMTKHRKQEIIEMALIYNVKILNIPPVNQWINGQLSFNQIRNVKIADLLGRDSIQLDALKIGREINGKIILITGAAGSIGSEIVRQILAFHPQKVLLFDNAETPLFYLELECIEKFRDKSFEVIVGDIRDKVKLEYVFEKYQPHLVFHAAAYKHVPMMERQPVEAYMTNVGGSRILADTSIKHQVEKFIMISTDKAVNPTNIMGATKRAAEIYIQNLNRLQKTKFITTRFGNVLGSNGSVIPLFKNQIENGGPVTITHPDVNRYFMTIPEACQLVLEASIIGNGGEIFIFDMGDSVNITDMAKKMIRLSGLELGKDIQIVYTGLRPGEKLYEELLTNEENTMPTHHPKILIGKIREYESEIIYNSLNEMEDICHENDNDLLVKKLKVLIPEFISQNSEYSKFDTSINN